MYPFTEPRILIYRDWTASYGPTEIYLGYLGMLLISIECCFCSSIRRDFIQIYWIEPDADRNAQKKVSSGRENYQNLY